MTFFQDFYVYSGAIWVRVEFNEQFHPVKALGFHRNKEHTEDVQNDHALFHHDTHRDCYTCHFPHLGNYKFEIFFNGREWVTIM